VGDDENNDDVISPELTDQLDLHTFLPKECADVVEEYLFAAQEAGLRASASFTARARARSGVSSTLCSSATLPWRASNKPTPTGAQHGCI
jgi:hypothetical protein